MASPRQPFPEVPANQLIQLFDIRDAPTQATRWSRRTSFGDIVAAARALTGRDELGIRTGGSAPSLMMATLAYLIFLELCGKLFVAHATGAKNPTMGVDLIPFAIRQWDPGALGCHEATCRRWDCHRRPDGAPRSQDQCSRAEHLYRLRCALAHDFSIQHSFKGKHFAFALAVGESSSTNAVRMPKRSWGGPPRQPSDSTTTVVDITALGDVAERVRQRIVGDVTLRFNRQVVLAHRDDPALRDSITAEHLRMCGLDVMTEAELAAARADPLDTGVYCGADGGLAALERCYFEYADWGPAHR